MDIKALRDFLSLASNSTYAASENVIKPVKEIDSSTSFTFEKDDFKYQDNYVGGEPYGGREIIWYKGKPCWIRIYYGWVDEKENNIGDIYGFLQKSMRRNDKGEPFVRGPLYYKEGDFEFFTEIKGDIKKFQGEEYISKNEKEVFRTLYTGGLVDQR